MVHCVFLNILMFSAVYLNASLNPYAFHFSMKTDVKCSRHFVQLKKEAIKSNIIGSTTMHAV